VNSQALLGASKDKLAAALEMLFASVDAYVAFDPARKSGRWVADQPTTVASVLQSWY
jgi:hypothetical protein